jgi:hypothetical protein
MNVDATLSAACRAQLRLVQSMRSANVRAESIVFNRDALSAYARNRPPLWLHRAPDAARDGTLGRSAHHGLLLRAPDTAS